MFPASAVVGIPRPFPRLTPRCAFRALVVLALSLACLPAFGGITCNAPGSTVPVAVDDYVGWPNAPIVISVLQNDYDPDGQPLTITAVSTPSPAGTVQIAGDKKSVTFFPVAGYTAAQFSYTIADSSGQSCGAPAWVYVKEAVPTASFTSDCKGRDCGFKVTLNTLENFRDYTWRFSCPGCTTIVKEKWRPHGYMQHFGTVGQWKVELEAYYHTGKVAKAEGTVNITPITPYIRFKQLDDGEPNDLCIYVEITETNVPSPLEGQYKMIWGDGTEFPFSHISGPIGAKADKCFAEPKLYPVVAHVRTNDGDEGTSPVEQIQVVNGPPRLSFTVTRDSADSNVVRKTVDAWDDGGAIVSWQWDMGDGWGHTYAYKNVDPYRYNKPGTFQVTLKATDRHGAATIATQEITIPNRPPTGKLRVECTDLQCVLSAIDAGDDGGIRAYNWNIAGQLITTTTPTYTHTFPAPGRYPIVATFSDGELSTPEMKRMVDVRAAAAPEKLALYTIPPCRAYDSIPGTLAAATTHTLTLANCVPADAVTVELNAVVVMATTGGDLTLWSPTEPQPITSNLNFVANTNRANNGAVRISNRQINARMTMPGGGNARLILDVVGFYASSRPAVAPEIGPLEYNYDGGIPSRVYDSRDPGGVKLNTSTQPQVSLRNGYAPSAVFSHIAVINPDANGHLVAYATGTSAPSTSIINFLAGGTTANGALIATPPQLATGNATLKFAPNVATATADYTADVFAQYRPATPDGYRYEAIKPCRLLDTRDPAYGEPRLKASERRAILAAGNCGIPLDIWYGSGFNGGALRVNLTVVNPAAAGTLKTIPWGGSYNPPPDWLKPVRAHYGAGATVATGSVVKVENKFWPAAFEVESQADTDLIVDVVGYYRQAPSFNYTTSGLIGEVWMYYNWHANMRGQWDYGDGQVSVPSVSHNRCKVYSLPGTYPVKLTAWDVTDPARKTVYERQVVVTNNPPVASLTSTQSWKTVTFDASTSRDEPNMQEGLRGVNPCAFMLPDSSALTFEWNFGDGTTGQGVGATHVYKAPGNYTVTLTARDRVGATGTAQKTVTIPSDPPTAKFFFNCKGLDCEFDGSESTDDGGIHAWHWNFAADPIIATYSPRTTWRFPASGTYAVSLVTTDGALASTPVNAMVNVTSAAPSPALSFFPTGPCRIYDSRQGTGARLPAGVITEIPLTPTAGMTKCGIPANAKAAALNFVMVDSSSAGYIRAWNGTAPDPVPSILNLAAVGANRANNAIVEIAATGKISVRPVLGGPTTSTHLIIDVYGYFSGDTTPAPGFRGPYRYKPITPCRTLDTRSTTPLSTGEIRYTKLDRQVCGTIEPPAALAANLTIINSALFGHATLFSSALGLPAEASTINFQSANVANGAIVELGARPEDDLGLKYVTFSPSTGHAVIDATGYFSPTGTMTYRPIRPCRILDTRYPEYGQGRLPSAQSTVVAIQGNCGIPRGATAIAVNTSILSPDGDGHLRLDRADRTMGNFSTLNFKLGDIVVGNHTIVELSNQQRDLAIRPTVFGGTGLDIVLDITGYFEPQASSLVGEKAAKE